MTPIRVLSAGLGNMGRSHALAYHANPGFEIAALVNRTDVALPEVLQGYRRSASFEEALTGLDYEVTHHPARMVTTDAIRGL